MDAAASRMIRIGSSSIGLIGLDVALNEAAAANLDDEAASKALFAAVSSRNYIPSGLEEQYRAALLEEYRRHRNPGAPMEEGLIIRIFGPGCVACNGLQNLVIEVMAKLQVAADIEQIHDPDEIGRAGILQTPALMINGKLKSMGLHPTPIQVEQWLREVIDD
jgi:hypothetical protein